MKELTGWFFEACREKKFVGFHIFTLIFVVLLGGCEKEKVDAQMENLCKEDGGITVYEVVPLPQEQFFSPRRPIFFKTWNESGGGYRFVRLGEQIKEDKPSLRKNTFLIIRESDNKILGTFVTYLRTGGGILPRLGPDPTKRCPSGIGEGDLLSRVFVSEHEGEIE